jgi:trk system potassium uptake protein TrkH
VLFRPAAEDFQIIGRFTGQVVYGIGAVLAVMAVVALALGEINEALAFVIGAAVAASAGATCRIVLPAPRRLNPTQGLATVAVVWSVAPVFGALPLLLSGHYAGPLDAYFEAMSGFATIGLTLVNDLDHLPVSMNLWRHAMHLLGGQGILLVVLTIFATAGGAAGTLYTGEGRAERVLPNIVQTARFILRVLVFYAALGLPALWLALRFGAGMGGRDAVFHSVTLFATAFHTAGFAPMSASAAFYRSPVVEAVLMVLMLAGAFSFALHYQLWAGRSRELTRNIEVRTFACTLLGIFTILAVGLARSGTYTEAGELLRIGFFQTVSAHTTTGLALVPGRLFVTDWGVLAPAMIVTAMALGGMAGSTAGGIKAIRVGLLAKGVVREVRRVLMPEDAVLVQHYHAGARRIVRDTEIRGAATILLLFFILYLAGGMIGLFYGYDLQLALFESTAAAATGGLSVGVLRPALETPLKVLYILQMLVGRLEFVAVFALAGYFVSAVRGRV